MRQNSETLHALAYLTGSAELTARLPEVPAKQPFDESVIDFLGAVSRELMGSKAAKTYPDVAAFAFWIRRSSVLKLKERFERKDSALRLGRGVVFHVAPSNVPVNFAYSLAAGLLTGNANVVRVPSRDFAQVGIIADAVNHALRRHEAMAPYVQLVRYGREQSVNDLLSSLADVRVVWGGDQTIAELRKSPLPPRSGEITFADRYSIAVIDSDSYLRIEDKERVAEDFYNDTFFSDQNACTSPRVIVWIGGRIEEAKALFWDAEHEMAKKKYTLQPVQGVNKLTSAYLAAAAQDVKIEKRPDNLIVRVSVPALKEGLMDYRDNSGYFYEYHCADIFDLVPLCNDKRCQTIGYIGDSKVLLPLVQSGVKGIDRIVPIGHTMDFDLIWDGYDLPALLTRTVVLA